MNVRTLFAGSIALGMALALVGCSAKDEPASPTAASAGAGATITAPSPTIAPPTPTPTPPPTVPPAPTATPSLAGVCPTNPDPAPASIAVVSQPLANASVTSPLTVTGMVAAFEAQFEAELLDGAQNQLASVHGMSQQGQQLSPFTVTLNFSVTAPTPGCLRIYQHSPADGSMTKVVQVPLVLMP